MEEQQFLILKYRQNDQKNILICNVVPIIYEYSLYATILYFFYPSVRFAKNLHMTIVSPCYEFMNPYTLKFSPLLSNAKMSGKHGS